MRFLKKPGQDFGKDLIGGGRRSEEAKHFLLTGGMQMPQGRPEDYAIEEIMQMVAQQQAPVSTGRMKGNRGDMPIPTNPNAEQQGVVDFYNPSRGYGFIEPDAGGKKVFVHQSELGGEPPIGAVPEAGDSLSYRSRPDPRGKGPSAYDVDDMVDDPRGISNHPKGNPEAPDYSDYEGTQTPGGRERMMDTLEGSIPGLQDTRHGGGDMFYNMLRGVVESPQGMQAYDVWKKTGDPSMLLEVLEAFDEPSYVDPNQLLE